MRALDNLIEACRTPVMADPEDDTLYAFLQQVRAPGLLAQDSAAAALAQVDEQVLLAMIQTGSQAEAERAMAEFYRRFALDLWLFLRDRKLPRPVLENVFAQTWLITLRRLPTFEWRGTSLRHWLWATAKRQLGAAAADHYQAAPLSYEDETTVDPAATAALNSEAGLIEDTGDNAERARILLRLRECLKEDDQRLFDLTYVKGLTSNQVGTVLNEKPATIRKRLERLRARLADCAARLNLQWPPDEQPS